MVHDNIISTWVYEHYLIYLSLSIADSDCMISESELDNIRCKSFPSLDQNRCTTLIKEVYREFWSHTEQERRNYISFNAPRFLRTDSIRHKVIQHLEVLIDTKDQESEEYIMFRFIRKVINNCR
jgi:hypothetical protein